MSEQSKALTLPSDDELKGAFASIKRFQALVQHELIENLDYGIIPGTPRPTLLKPGAEKIAKLLGLSDSYDIVAQVEDWDKPLFYYQVKCRLESISSGILISQGLGSCNSMEARYRYRWVAKNKLPEGIQIDTLPKKYQKTETGGFYVYRIDNDDIYTLVNTILKMAKKRALVDATLSAGRLSNIFTQDIEDMGLVEKEEPDKKIEETPPTKQPPKAPSPIKGETKVEAPLSPTAENFPKPEAIKNRGDLRTAWHKFFPKEPWEEALAIIGVESQSQIANASEAWEQILKIKIGGASE